jgi:hypothetical protein
MEPLHSIPMPTHGVLLGINTLNSWPAFAQVGAPVVRLAYIATNSTQRLSFVSLQSAAHAQRVLRVASRPPNFEDMPYGLVVEVHLAQDIAEGETVHLALAQAGATTYFPPQQIDDAK